MSTYNETMEILKRYKIQANKKLGQNFLIDENTINTIIEASDIKQNDLVIEIGPGLGVLTSRLISNAYKVIAVELDPKMVAIIKDRFKLENNLEIINEDILKVNLKSLINDEKNEAIKHGIEIGKVKIVANLPYYISTPIIMKLLEERLDISNIIVMVQKEVADRLIADPGTKLSGAITYAVNYYANASKVLDVSKECFIPSPKVESEVIKLDIRKEPKIKTLDEKSLFNLIKISFTQRRKTLANALVNYNIVCDKNEGIKILKLSNLDENVRGETLTLEEFESLNKNLLFKNKSKNGII